MKKWSLIACLLSCGQAMASADCNELFGSYYYNLYTVSNLASARLVLLDEMKKVMHDCDEATIRKWKPKVVLSQKEFEADTQKLPEDIARELENPNLTPVADLDGSVGFRVRRLNEHFKLTLLQKNRLQRAVRTALAQTKKRLRPVSEKCRREKNLSGQLPAAFDQKDSSMCSSFTMAAQLGKKLLAADEARRDPISAGAVTLLYQIQEKVQPTGFLGGDFENKFKATQAYGACRESEVSSDLKYMKEVKSVQDYQRLFPKLSEQRIRDEMHGESSERMKKLLEAACPHPIQISQLRADPAKAINEAADPKLIEDIQELILNDEIVAFSTRGFYRHAMLVIGQKYNPETQMCDFLVRNSYGPDCGLGRKGAHADAVFKRCDGEGNFSVPASLMAEQVFEIQSIQVRKPAVTAEQVPAGTKR